MSNKDGKGGIFVNKEDLSLTFVQWMENKGHTVNEYTIEDTGEQGVSIDGGDAVPYKKILDPESPYRGFYRTYNLRMNKK